MGTGLEPQSHGRRHRGTTDGLSVGMACGTRRLRGMAPAYRRRSNQLYRLKTALPVHPDPLYGTSMDSPGAKRILPRDHHLDLDPVTGMELVSDDLAGPADSLSPPTRSLCRCHSPRAIRSDVSKVSEVSHLPRVCVLCGAGVSPALRLLKCLGG